MRVSELRIQNFYSTKSLEIDLSEYRGISLIEGYNHDNSCSNGAGKSTILEAICWAITGKTIRKSVENSLVNNQSKGGCEVEVLINGNIRIFRSKRPTKLELYVDDEPRTLDHARNTQALIYEILGVDYKTLMSSLIFGQHNNIDFLSASAEDKRDIIKTFLNIDYIFKYKEKIRELKSECKSEIKSYDLLIESHEATEGKAKSNISSTEEAIKKLPDCSNWTFDSLEKAFQLYRERLSEFRDKEQELREKRADLKKEKAKLSKASANIPYECSECGTTLYKRVKQDEKSKEYILDQIATLGAEERALYAECTKLKESLPTKPKITLKEFSELDSTRKSLEKSLEVFQELLEEAKESREQAVLLKFSKSQEYDRLRFWEVAFSEKGVVRFVIRNILDFFNERCNYFLNFLSNGRFSITFDESLNETIVANGSQLYYISLSGGEKRKFNLSVLLALQSLISVTEREKSEIVFLDEVTADLDKEGIDGLYLLLQDLKKTKDIFIITHDKYLKKLLEESNTIKVEKREGITTLCKDQE